MMKRNISVLTTLFQRKKAQGNAMDRLIKFDFSKAEGKKDGKEGEAEQLIESLRHFLAQVYGMMRTLDCTGKLLHRDMSGIEASSREVSSAVEEVAGGNTRISELVSEVLENIGEANGFLRKLEGDISDIRENTIKSNELVQSGKSMLDSHNCKLSENMKMSQDMSVGMKELEKTAAEIDTIIRTITAFSEQTNMLAINAAIEAARAGESGRGFAVVADEIRKLSDHTKLSTGEIKGLVDKIKRQVSGLAGTVEKCSRLAEEQKNTISETEKTFERIAGSVGRINAEAGDIFTEVNKIVSAAENIGKAVENASSHTQETAACSEELNASIEEQVTSIAIINERVLEFGSKIGTISDQLDRFRFIKIAHTEYDDSTMQAEILKEVIARRLGLAAEGIAVPGMELWRSVAEGKAEGTAAPWMPYSDAKFLQQYGNDLEVLSPNMQGCKFGFVVPQYAAADSISDLARYSKEFDRKIYSIQRKTVVGGLASAALEKYGLFDFEIQYGDEQTMLQALEKKVKNKEWVIVTGWQPHRKFALYPLKFLKDEKEIFGKEEYTQTLVRKGLSAEAPELYNIFKSFSFRMEGINKALENLYNGMTYREAAKLYLKEYHN